jgi:hypothetical protein
MQPKKNESYFMDIIVKWHFYVHKGPLLDGSNPICRKYVGSLGGSWNFGNESVENGIKLDATTLVNSLKIHTGSGDK